MCLCAFEQCECVYVRERSVSSTWVALSCDDSNSADGYIIPSNPSDQTKCLIANSSLHHCSDLVPFSAILGDKTLPHIRDINSEGMQQIT